MQILFRVKTHLTETKNCSWFSVHVYCHTTICSILIYYNRSFIQV